MSQLAQLQRAFHDHIIDPDNPIAERTTERIADRIVARSAADAARRLSVYADGYRLRLVEVLEQDYPGLRALLGEAAFDVLARGYLHASPSTHYSLRWFGARLATHLAGLPVHATRPELAEMAGFEWGWGECFDAADAAPIDETALATLAADAWLTLSFIFLPGVRQTNTQFNIAAVWQAVQDDAPPPALARLPEAVEVLLWRSAYNVRWRALERDEAPALAAARRGATFPDMCDALIAAGVAEDDVPLRAATLIKRWLHEGLVCALRTPGANDPAPSHRS